MNKLGGKKNHKC
jgi:hypothetical protein